MTATMQMHEDLEFLRQAMGLTQQQAADEIGVHLNSFRRWAAGEVRIESISVDHYLKLQRVMDRWRTQVRERLDRQQ